MSRKNKPDQSEKTESTVSSVAEGGVALLGPAIQQAATHATFKFVGNAGRNFPMIGKFLDELGEYSGAVDGLPGAVNLAMRKFLGSKFLGSEILGDEFREVMVHVADGFADAVREAKGDELKKVTGKAVEIAKAAVQKVASIEFCIDAAGFGHQATCLCAAGLTKKMNYDQAAEAGLKIASCCVPEYRREAYTRVLLVQRRDQEPLEVLGNMESHESDDYLAWVRQLPTSEEQSVAMHALVDLSSSSELKGFLLLNYTERYRYLDLLRQRVEKRHGTRERIEAFAQRLENYDASLAPKVKERRAIAMASWARLQQPPPISILGMLGL
jgi:hypothetical protein